MSGMDQLNNTVRKTVAGAGITGICASLGGLAGGPVGIAVGGTVGGIVSAKILGKIKTNKILPFSTFICFFYNANH